MKTIVINELVAWFSLLYAIIQLIDSMFFQFFSKHSGQQLKFGVDSC